MIILTGGAGFIGSCILSRLNKMGRDDIIVVDHLAEDSVKAANLDGKRYQHYFDKTDFLKLIREDRMEGDYEILIHMGACSSTTLNDPDYYRVNNFQYSCHLAQWAQNHRCRLIFASSGATYGDGHMGYSDADDVSRKLKPLNLYGKSKLDFDLWVLDNGMSERFVGLRFFNVFGPNEYHKAEMRSVILKAYPRVKKEGRIFLFKSYRPDYADGEQKRDFIYVKDAVDVVLYLWEHPEIHGIFNLGTGQARSWNDVARALFRAVGKTPRIEYVDMPSTLRDQYQYFTQADMTKLRASGYRRDFTPLEEAVQDYAGYLETGGRL